MENKLPDGWEWKKLSDLADFFYGGAFESSYFNEDGKGIKIIRIRNLKQGFTETYYDGEYDKSYLVQNGDILIGMDGEFNIVKWTGETALLNQRVCKIIVKSKDLLSDFAYRSLVKILKDIESRTAFVTVKHLSAKELNAIRIPLPPLETQQKIVSVLEKAEETKKLRAQADELTQKLLQSVFLEMFGDLETNPKGWVVNGFDHFAKIDTKMTKDFAAYENKPHIGIENIEKDTGNLINYKEVGAQNLTSGKYFFTKDHIIYSKIRPNLNKVALPDFDGLCSADAYPLLVNNNYTNRYFFCYILRSKYFLDNILKLSDRTNIPKVNKDQLRSFECICPPIELQNQFAELVEHVEKIKKSQNQSSLEINNLFDALMQKAFTGELVS